MLLWVPSMQELLYSFHIRGNVQFCHGKPLVLATPFGKSDSDT